MKIMAFFCGIFVALLVVIHTNNAHADRILYFDRGQETEVSVTKLAQIMQVFDVLEQGEDDQYHLIVTSNHIREVKQKRRGVEIILADEYEKWKNSGLSKVRRVLVPFCSQNTECTVATFYLGDATQYWTPPHINSKGGVYLNKIEEIIAK